jgi:hypothetical protein
MHRRIYQAIRAHDAAGARDLMNAHLVQASQYQAQEQPHSAPPAVAESAALPSRRGHSRTPSH